MGTVAGERLVPDIGPRLRAARQRRGHSLRELARTIGVSASLVSQVETGRLPPSTSTLNAMLAALDLTLDRLLAEQPPPSPQRAGDTELLNLLLTRLGHERATHPAGTRRRFRIDTGVTWERLTDVDPSLVDFFALTYDVGGATSQESLHQHRGREFGLVLAGRLCVQLGYDEHQLGAGDSISFDSMTPHRISNPGDLEARAVWVTLGRGPYLYETPS